MIIVKNNSLFIKQGNKETPIFNEGNLEFCYTKKNEDIAKRYIDSFAQYTSYKQSIPSNDFQLSTFSLENGIRINIKKNSNKISSWGINLPFNFMGKLNGGGFAGSIICAVPVDMAKKFSKSMSKYYGKDNVVQINIRKYGPRSF